MSDIRVLRHSVSYAEEVLWELLRAKRLAGFEFCRRCMVQNVLADFYCKPARLIVVIQADGGPTARRGREDVLQMQRLRMRGYKVIRFTRPQIISAPKAVSQQILDAVFQQIE